MEAIEYVTQFFSKKTVTKALNFGGLDLDLKLDLGLNLNLNLEEFA